MNWIGIVTAVGFQIGWAAGFAAGLYGVYHQFLAVFGSRDRRSHWRKTLNAVAAFVGCFVFGMLNNFIGIWFGGWPTGAR